MSTLLLLIFLASMLLLVDRTIGITNFVHPAIFFLYFHVIFFYLGLLAITAYENVILVDPQVTRDIVSSFTSFCVVSSLGYIFCEKVLRGNNTSFAKNTIQYLDNYTLHAFYIIFCLGFMIYLLFVAKSGFIAFLSHNLEVDRIVARKGMGAVTILSINMVTYSGLVLALNTRSWLNRSIIFLFTGIALLGFGNRGPFLTFLILFYILYMLLKGNRVSIYKLVLSGVVVFCLFVVLGILRKEATGDSLLNLFTARFFWRPFVNIYNYQNIINTFPGSHKFIGGDGFLMDLATLLPGYSANFQTWVKDVIGLDFDGGGVTVTYLGDFYINFGRIGLIVAPILYAIVFNFVYFVLKNTINNRSVVTTVNAILISYSLSPIVGSGLFPAILNCLVPLLLVTMMTKATAVLIKHAFGRSYNENITIY